MLKDNMTHSSVKHRIAKELQPLIVQRASLVVALSRTLVGQCQFVVADVIRIEAYHLSQLPPQFLIIAEGQAQAFDNVSKVHTS